MKKRVLYIILGIVLIVVLCFIVLFIRNILEDNRKTNEKMEKIQIIKTNFDEKINDYNKNRSSIRSIVDDIVVDKFEGAYDTVNLLLKKEESTVLEVKDYVSQLDKYCNGKVYPDSYVNSFCLEYKINYEEMVNVFLEDVKNVNGIIEKYNSSYDKELKIYSGKIEKYIDYNKDGSYSGKEE